MAAPSLDDLPASFELYLRATNKSRRTIETYREALDGFMAHLQATSKRPLDQARREDVEAWMTALLARWKPATAHNRYRGLHAFYRCLEEEEDIPSPMAKMRPRRCRNNRSRSSASSSCAPCSTSGPARTSTPDATPRC